MGEYYEKGNKIPLIYFMYKDIEMINSFYSQVFSGNLIGINKSSSSEIAVSTELSSELKVFNAAKNTNDMNSQAIEHNIDPHDSKIIDLFNELSNNLEEKSLEEYENGQLIKLKGSIKIRNLDAIQNALPIMESLGLLEELKTPLDFPHKKNKKYNLYKLIKETFNLIPKGIELEIKTSYNENIIGLIKEEYLTYKSTDLLKVFGSTLPGEWEMIGIITKRNKNNYTFTSKSMYRQATDELSTLLNEFINSDGPEYAIIPVVIYKNVIY
ncbi:hypothetical protein SAMN02745883_00739 [Caminicella sporogenes DSM 14501]|uniref:Uncharacterized protein n=1 Tax=Caminicella sporogenes DSM 14501 TaxID=1121266 RepID=A0A1M6N0I6_9FIRM|nr:hypothetical protein [Caminicella sporogenes]RKD22415.1 hypothetical protein BET04_05125 [Caminicella sporogenes]WIF95060.1 hypothetical protein QNI18_12490 [Caminicella sporogenes]SHJ89230.1 hypothetical protein SAMN02745883_00739 [Caminicella sporogenes DSM 14501]